LEASGETRSGLVPALPGGDGVRDREDLGGEGHYPSVGDAHPQPKGYVRDDNLETLTAHNLERLTSIY
jgi:hypothetical protein